MSTMDNMLTKVVKLPPILDAAAAADILGKFRQLPEPFWPVHLHAGAVEKVSLAYVQVITAATKSNENFAIVDPSAAFAETFDDLGLSYRQAASDAPAPDLGNLVVADRQERSDVENDVEDAGVAEEHVTEQHVEDRRAGDEHAENERREEDVPSQSTARESTIMRIDEPEESAAEEARTEEPVVSKRILTIDDSKTIRDMLRLTLAQAGFTVLQAVDGVDGMDVLGREQVDVVITDINMPKMDGYGVIRHIRENAAYDDMPILVLSTESDPENKNAARDAGATGWIVKPFVPDQLVDVVRKVCA